MAEVSIAAKILLNILIYPKFAEELRLLFQNFWRKRVTNKSSSGNFN